MSIVERLFPASELESLQTTMRNFSAGPEQKRQRQDISPQARLLHAPRSTSSHGFEPTSKSVELAQRKIKAPQSRRSRPPNFVLLTHGLGKHGPSKVVYALDKARTDACQYDVASKDGVDDHAVPRLFQASGGSSRKRVAAQAETARKCLWREGGKCTRPLPGVDQETGQHLRGMPLITMHERALLASLLPSPTPRVNDEDLAQQTFKRSLDFRNDRSHEVQGTRAEPDLFEYLNFEETGW